MSGICGILGLGGGSPDEAAIGELLEPLKRRGPDGTGAWVGDGVALGHASLATTPEALSEKLPLQDRESQCTITADARLDNRDDLIDGLGLGREGKGLGDGQLILRSYLKWGEDCPNRLLGDFAFAIWDSRRRRLFCARDPIGMRQLAYAHLRGAAFVFATEPEAVLRFPAIPQRINRVRIADFLDGLEGFDDRSTFFEGISRLPAAHCLTADRNGVGIRRYWTLRTPPTLRLSSDAEYADAFRDVFGTAVRARLRSPDPVGAMLSGGMDSGSIAAVAAQILRAEGKPPLKTFSVVAADPAECVETRAVHAAARMAGIEPTFVSLGSLDAYRDDLLRLMRDGADPFDGDMNLVRAVYLAAHRAGVRVVLDGAAGDVVTGSRSCAARLLRRGRILAGLREAWDESRFWGAGWPAWKSLGTAAARAWIPRSLRAARRRAEWRLQDRRIGRTGLISSAFAAEADLRARREQRRAKDSEFDRLDADERARRIAHANLTTGRERYDRVASALAIEPRDPFLDLRVIDFCLSLPWDQVQSGGWPKILLRRAMAGWLPDDVLWRKGKEHLGAATTRALLAPLDGIDPRPRNFDATIGPYVDCSRVNPFWIDRDKDCNNWVKAICLFHWLESAERSLRR